MNDDAISTTAAERLIEVAQKHFRFGQNLAKEPFAAPRSGANVAHYIYDKEDGTFRMLLAREYRRIYKKVPSNQQMESALQILRADCYDATPESCYCRVAPGSDGGIVVDLGRDDGKAVLIYPNERRWHVADRSPVLFHQTAVMSAMPLPLCGGSLDEIPQLLGLSDQHWNLILGWLITAYFRDIPHPLLAIFGPAGAGKSFLARLVVQLSDPSPCPLRSSPRKEEDWDVSVASSWVYAIDNLSVIQPWFADALCKAATGDARVVRKHYTNKGLSVSYWKLPIILTGIEVGSLRSDLGDRLVMLELTRQQSPRKEQELEAIISERLPYWLGALFDGVSRVLEARPLCRPTGPLPRMADFAHLLAAADKAGVTDGAAEAYTQNRRDTAREVGDGDEVVEAISRLLQGEPGGRWDGSATELLLALNAIPGLGRGSAWPKAANRLSAHLKRLSPTLADCGVRYEARKHNVTRKRAISLLLTEKEKPSLGSLGSLANRAESAVNRHFGSDDPRAIPERSLDAKDNYPPPNTRCPSDPRTIPERCSSWSDHYLEAPAGDDLRKTPHSKVERDYSHSGPAHSLYCDYRQLLAKGAEVMVTKDTEAVGLDGASVRVAGGQTGFLAHYAESVTDDDRDFFHRLVSDHPYHCYVLVSDRPLILDSRVMRLAARIALA